MKSKSVICQYCNNPSVLMTTKDFYGKDYGTNVWVCRPCNAYVGTHGKTNKPKGTLANARLRGKRIEAHSFFDQLWKGKRMSRKNAYKWMQEAMQLSKDKAHIGMFDEWQCIVLISHIKERLGLDERHS